MTNFVNLAGLVFSKTKLQFNEFWFFIFYLVNFNNFWLFLVSFLI